MNSLQRCLHVRLALLGMAAIELGWAQSGQVPGVPVSIVITAETGHGKEVPALEANDIQVQQGRDKRPVVGLKPLGPISATMQLLILISDSAQSSFGTEIDTLKQFVASLAPATEVAIGYMRNGTNQMASSFTGDHRAAAESIRLTAGVGGADVSPYDSLSEAIKNWPSTPAERKAVIMISNGVEGLGGGYTSDNPYVDRGIADAQKAGIVVYTIYTPGDGHFGHTLWRNTWGQNFLSQLADETGGESYMIGFGAPVSFQPFLEQIKEQWKHQYRLTFEAKPENKAGLQAIKVEAVTKSASIAAPDRVFVKAGR